MTDQDKGLDFSSILASSVHDMKNSLGLLISTLDEIVMGCDPEQCETHEQFSLLQYESKRLNSNLIQLLALYKIGNSQYFLNVAEQIVAEFVEETFLPHQELLDNANISLAVECPEDLVWFFDKELVSGVITNVINNTYKYTKGTIHIEAKEQDGFLRIRIMDDGGGYPPSMLAAAADRATGVSFSSGSTGLGLYFADQVARLHRNKDNQGYIALSNEGIDGGGCFTLYLP